MWGGFLCIWGATVGPSQPLGFKMSLSCFACHKMGEDWSCLNSKMPKDLTLQFKTADCHFTLSSLIFRTSPFLRLLASTRSIRFFEACGNSSSSSSRICSPSSSSRICSSSSSSRLCNASDPSPPAVSSDSRICDEKWVVPDLRQNFFRSLVQKDPQQQQISETGFVALKGGEPEVKVVDFSMESLLQFKMNHVEHTAHAYHQEKHRLRPAYDNRKRRFAAVQPADRKSYLIPIIILISVFSFFCYAWFLFSWIYDDGIQGALGFIKIPCRVTKVPCEWNKPSKNSSTNEVTELPMQFKELLPELLWVRVDEISRRFLGASQDFAGCLRFKTWNWSYFILN